MSENNCMMKISYTKPMSNTRPRTRENDIRTYDAPNSGSGMTGAISRVCTFNRRERNIKR